MNEDYVSYDLALKLKACGFDEPCDHFYEHRFDPNNATLSGSNVHGEWNDIDAFKYNFNSISDNRHKQSLIPYCSAPLLYHAQKWLREKKGIEVVVEPRFCNYKHIGYDWEIFDDFSGDYSLRAPLPFVDTYEAAISAGISSAIDLLAGKDGDG